MRTKIAFGVIRRHCIAEAVLVTADNLNEVAAWCHGAVRYTDGSAPSEPFVQPPVIRTSYDNKPRRAFVGDYIIKDEQGYKVYRESAYAQMYDELSLATVNELINDMNKVI